MPKIISEYSKIEYKIFDEWKPYLLVILDLILVQ